jgi:hypothetical protein
VCVLLFCSICPLIIGVLASELLHLSRKDIDELSMPMTHLEWRMDSRHESTAPLKLVESQDQAWQVALLV